MAPSGGSVETSANSHPAAAFTFPTATSARRSSSNFMTTSLSDLLARDGDEAPSTSVSQQGGLSSSPSDHRIADRSASGVPKFKSTPPASLPISPLSVYSPSSYLTIPHGLSPSELLDSPVLLNASNILPSPTTGSFPAHRFLNNNCGGSYQRQQQETWLEKYVKQEDKNHYPDFTFQPPPTSTSSRITTTTTTTTPPTLMKEESCSRQQQQQQQRKTSEDGYNWRKYGQKQVKGSENPRSYYKCTYPNCPTKKKVERGLDGQITEIVYKGSHNHPKPQSSTRKSASASASTTASSSVVAFSSSACGPPDHHPQIPILIHQHQQLFHVSSPDPSSFSSSAAATPDNSSISIGGGGGGGAGDDDFDPTSREKCRSGGDDLDLDEDEPEAKRWKIDSECDQRGSAAVVGSRTVREPRVVVQTTSDIDILDDGYRWRKYGQKVVKGNPNPRSYYKCTNVGCPVRKHVERASHDLRAVITTYEGKHNHDVPAARGSGSHYLARPLPSNKNNNADHHNTARASPACNSEMRPSGSSAGAVAHHLNPLRNVINSSGPHQGQVSFTLEMLQTPAEMSFGFSSSGGHGSSSMGGGFLTSSDTAQPPQQMGNVNDDFSRAKEEPWITSFSSPSCAQ